MGKTPIEWTDFSVNPFRAENKFTGQRGHFCVKVSPGCKLCYSSRLQPRLGAFPFLAENRNKVNLVFDNSKLLDVARRKIPTKYFWCDMTDMFWEEYPDEWIDQCIGVMAWTRQHIHQVLTKRADRLMRYSQGLAALSGKERSMRMAKSKGFAVTEENCGEFRWPLPNVWFGTSVEDQQRADERIPLLIQTPAAVRFVSYEPALGPVDFTKIDYRKQLRDRLCAAVRWSAERDGDADVKEQVQQAAASVPDGDLGDGNPALNVLTGEWFDGWDSGQKLHWVIVGGESGPGARPFDIAWARDTIQQCKDAGVACFVKQFGASPYSITDRIAGRAGLPDGSPDGFYLRLNDSKGGDPEEWPEDLRVREFPAGIEVPA
jgi:protein gp37